MGDQGALLLSTRQTSDGSLSQSIDVHGLQRPQYGIVEPLISAWESQTPTIKAQCDRIPHGQWNVWIEIDVLRDVSDATDALGS